MAWRAKKRSAVPFLLFFATSVLFSTYVWLNYFDAPVAKVWERMQDLGLSSLGPDAMHAPFATDAVATGPLTMDPKYDPTQPPQERVFDWTVERAELAPDGIPRLMYTINGQFPGPLIEVTEGDTVVVRVRNHMYDNYTMPPPPLSSQREDVHPEGTDKKFTFHWHGLSMRNTQVMDGASAFTSCALRPGEEREYRFLVHPEDVGTHWYHSHVGTSRADGLWGMFIVHSRSDERKEFQSRSPDADTHWDEEITVALGDHFHKFGPINLGFYVSRWLQKAEPVPENALINGKNIFTCHHSRLNDVPCPAGDADQVGEYSTFSLRPDQAYRLRLVNVGALADITFSVDGHTMTVIEADGTLVKPVRVHRIPIAPGQRYSVILHKEPKSKDARFWMRADMSPDCFQYTNPVMELSAKAIVAYDTRQDTERQSDWESLLRMRSYKRNLVQQIWYGRLSASLPATLPWSTNETDPILPEEPCHDLEPDTLLPLIPDPAPPLRLDQGDHREYVFVTAPILERYGIVPMGFMNGSTWRPYGHRGRERRPLLHRIAHANTTTVEGWREQDVFDSKHELVASPHPSRPVVMEMVINNQDDSPHPFHLHGHKFWVMQTGEMDPEFGGFNYYEDVGQVYDLDRKMKRDTVIVPMLGHAVIRWVADNPGVWALHCHMLVHLNSGMAMAIVEQPALLQARPPVPPICS
ncbi:L-ascorbate oxidase [Malassezia nana]|uniref:laccase n=1 Tax=Malassezia nana TaxID=180528 RepID=A0AAF0J956_9BASI|nr:L-ascorbate oxidase [Malassezia nana]